MQFFATNLHPLRSSLFAAAALLVGALAGCDEPRQADPYAVAVVIAAADELAAPGAVGEVAVCDADEEDADECGDPEDTNNTICYCGYVKGVGVVYVEANCAGYPGTHVCCAAACSAGAGDNPQD